MELKKLAESFYNDNPKITQALDFDDKTQKWLGNKVRGHGIVSITVNGLIFAIPVRSHIKHKAAFILEVNTADRNVKGMGLDYSKSMLIRDDKHVTQDVFVLCSKSAGKKLLGKEDHITKQFNKYVTRYIKVVQNDDQRVLNSYEYRFTTLVNYHTELGL